MATRSQLWLQAVARQVRQPHPQQIARTLLRMPWEAQAQQLVEATEQTTFAELVAQAGSPEPGTLFGDLAREAWNVRIDEQLAIGLLVRIARPQRIFEFGTFDGDTTRYLAQQAGEAAHVWTLDLPDEAFAELHSGVAWFTGADVGRRFRGTPEVERITQLRADSTAYDFAELAATMDLVFVDAGHDYEHVLHDSRVAFRLIKPGGYVLWHDYGSHWPGVVLAVQEICTAHGSVAKQVYDTALAYACTPAQAL